MARTHEVPNHLNVQDTLFLGLTARQVATFMAFASPGVWDLGPVDRCATGSPGHAGSARRAGGHRLHADPTWWSTAGRMGVRRLRLRGHAAAAALVPTGTRPAGVVA